MNAQQNAQAVIARCKELFEKVEQKWPHLNMKNVGIRFDLRGRAAGMACYRPGQAFIRFNTDMLGREAFDHLINNTVPHEIAHIVCFMDPRLGSNHDSGWQDVCTALGGNGARCHKEEVVYGKGHTYEYLTDAGHKVRIGDRHHKHVQGGRPLRFLKGKGTITNMSAYSIVGYQGRTLPTPIVKRAPNAAQELEHAAVTASLNKPLPAPVARPTPDVRYTIPAPAPVARTVTPAPAPAAQLQQGASKASISRQIMATGHASGLTYEEIIAKMIAACGYTRQLARATYKANYARAGVPQPA